MPDIFKAFELSESGLRPRTPAPEPITAQARREATLLQVENPNISQRELDALAETCLALLAKVRAEDGPLPIGTRATDTDAHLLSALADDATSNGTLGQFHPGTQPVQAWQLMSAYTLLMLDRAAICALSDDILGTIDALCQAMESSRNTTLWWTGDTIEAETAGAGSAHARTTKRLQAIDPLKDYVQSRWESGRDDGRPWKSKRSCAIAIVPDVIARAKAHGWEMSGKEPERTVYKWLRELAD